MTEWIVPGTSTAAVIFVVLVFLRQQRYTANKHERQIAALTTEFRAALTTLQTQLQQMETARNANEERRMNQIQGIFDKFMTLATQMVQGMTEMKHAFAALAAKVEGKIDKEKT